MENTKTKLGLRQEPFRFSSAFLAKSFSNRTRKITMIMHGDDGKFWVVLPADAEKLNRNGYEYAGI